MQAQPVLAVHKSELAEASKECPFCGEHVRASAKKCKHCGETIDLALRAAEESRRWAEQSSRSQGPNVFMNAGGAAAASSSSSRREYRERRPKPFSHGVHLILTLVTCGAWLPIWILLAILHKG